VIRFPFAVGGAVVRSKTATITMVGVLMAVVLVIPSAVIILIGIAQEEPVLGLKQLLTFLWIAMIIMAGTVEAMSENTEIIIAICTGPLPIVFVMLPLLIIVITLMAGTIEAMSESTETTTVQAAPVVILLPLLITVTT